MPRGLTSVAARHAEWLSLLDVAGPFLDLGIVTATFPQGLDGADDDARQRRALQMLYETRQADLARRRPDAARETRWFETVLRDVLGWPASHIRAGQALPPDVEARLPEHGETLRPDLVLMDRDRKRPLVLVSRVAPGQNLNQPTADRNWAETPANRMVELLHQTGYPLGLVTNGEAWMVVNAPAGQPSGFATWFANLWFEEHATFVAFRDLLGQRRCFGVPDDQTLPALLDRSRDAQTDVTTQLGGQVREAVELLVAGIARADAEHGGDLLRGIPESEVYQAALTVMMRTIFLLYAEDQQPPLFGDNDVYDQHYSISGLFRQLREARSQDIEAMLEQKEDAWSRMLAAFRLVYGGSAHDRMRLPAYGGSLFDPDRFPFLEGRRPGSDWRTDVAKPLGINNREVLHMLEAVMLLDVRVGRTEREARRVSFRALDVEQIGHVYEQLLEHTCKRATGIVLGLTGTTRNGVRIEPEAALTQLEAWLDAGVETLARELKAIGGPSTVNAVRRALDGGADLEMDHSVRRLIPDAERAGRVLRFAGLIRRNRAGAPWIVLDGELYVTKGEDRRTTGAHYTPRILTEPIVRHALEPVIFHGPAEGLPKEEWRLHGPARLLQTTICDPAMGSGAFLVQTARYLGERLVEAWDREEAGYGARTRARGGYPAALMIGPDGELSADPATAGGQTLPSDPAERLLLATRLVVDHCLYGVDVNPLAVEMAKLSLWLVTLQRNRPFTFLDHRLRCGDSLLGIRGLGQLERFSVAPAPSATKYRQMSWFVQQTKTAVDEAIRLRHEIEAMPANDVAASDAKAGLLRKAQQLTGLLRLGADLLVGSALYPDARRRDAERQRLQDLFSLQMEAIRRIQRGEFTAQGQQPTWEALAELRQTAHRLLAGHRTFHWPLEFPEVFVEPAERGESPGFAAIVGNPPFMGGRLITGAFGTPYRDYLIEDIAGGVRGSADLVSYFLLRAGTLLRQGGEIGMLATNTVAQGDTREVGLDQMTSDGFVIPRAVPSRRWPGTAALEVAHLWLRRGDWAGGYVLDDAPVSGITPYLTIPGRATGTPYRLAANAGKSFQGSIVLGMGFVLEPEEAAALIAKDSRNRDVLYPYLNGEDLNSRPDQSPSRWVINFHDWSIGRAMEYPDCFRIIEEKVKPERQRTSEDGRYVLRRPLPQRWWQYADKRPALYATIAGMEWVLVISETTKYFAFSDIRVGPVFSHSTKIVTLPYREAGAVLNSSLHSVWSQYHGQDMGNTPRYMPTDVFETFAFPQDTSDLSEIIGRLFSLRSSCMVDSNFGLTTFYNHVQDPENQGGFICAFRRMQTEVDNAVAAAYGWEDLDLGHGFHETRQGVRFTISEAARREVLDRLLELNHARYAEEVAQGLHPERGQRSRRA